MEYPIAKRAKKSRESSKAWGRISKHPYYVMITKIDDADECWTTLIPYTENKSIIDIWRKQIVEEHNKDIWIVSIMTAKCAYNMLLYESYVPNNYACSRLELYDIVFNGDHNVSNINTFMSTNGGPDYSHYKQNYVNIDEDDDKLDICDFSEIV